MHTISIIGGGAWGTALAQVYASAGRETLLWAREADVISSINAHHENTPFLPGISLSPTLKATNDLKQAAAHDILLLVPPAQHLRSTMTALKDHLHNKPIVICAKGIEIETGKLLTEIAHEIGPKAKISVLTGPTFAAEIARGLPAAVTLAARDQVFLEGLQTALATPIFRPYITTDIVGAQIAGAVKNVIAIACGIAHGKGFGESARAALITRGAAEISRLALAMGARTETLQGLCGMGDLVLTCSSMQSRNFSLGAALGQGRSLADILGERTAVTEGVYTAKGAAALAGKQGVEMPITEAVNSCLNNGLSVDTAIKALLNRPLKTEF
jgi:glycerol-3-phosphate dehydrogenase (NAD(P)+)